ncbi:hypothetical protein ISF_09241 [Cordyceps fumosorosea ARSEF 2679]|uniref:Uncharacterized protein n=1 Tax=Cordyceps fumosorosea (strain ARSEF 2679) TaxID=1081104 RepID=A0A162K3K7_CORFA|nr:hypothetical protein ISF_09241 [Cordyceps fumosorosea ARSEF 2679]OAA52858.1 hypothetical protein ISF_09241 [Cordyceps fumosorosea ARSEF 2679]
MYTTFRFFVDASFGVGLSKVSFSLSSVYLGPDAVKVRNRQLHKTPYRKDNAYPVANPLQRDRRRQLIAQSGHLDAQALDRDALAALLVRNTSAA